MRTNVPGVWAVGDCNGKLMLAHTAYREAEVAVNDMLGKKDAIDYSIIPSVIYTTPEVACVGETEQSAREKGLDVQVVKAPMALSGRYLAENPKGTGFCKLLYDRKNRCVVGVHMVGSYVSEIIYGAAMMVHSKLPVQHLDKYRLPPPPQSARSCAKRCFCCDRATPELWHIENAPKRLLRALILSKNHEAQSDDRAAGEA